ncbi:MAG: class I SAM-dependent methyltransferase [bacterium]|nr:class I SAM-dependent methyltransferase [bacterium]
MIRRAELRDSIERVVRRLYLRTWRWNQRRRYRGSSPREVFSDIYERGLWGESLDDFSSGGGTINEKYVDPYVRLVAGVVDDLGLTRTRVVDLGCGDFMVGQRLLASVGDRIEYRGLDVVPRLIDRNRERFGAAAVQFECLDAIAEPLPEGDLCLIRQVFQHLSNEQVASVLAKLSQYPLVLVTEHQPTDLAAARPNLDKLHGFDTRLGRGSGVFLKPPSFSVNAIQAWSSCSRWSTATSTTRSTRASCAPMHCGRPRAGPRCTTCLGPTPRPAPPRRLPCCRRAPARPLRRGTL